MYELGEFLRQRYSVDLNYLSKTYIPSEVRYGFLSACLFVKYMYVFVLISNWRMYYTICYFLQIYVQSTDVNRCLMSAQSVLASLFPPAGAQQWNTSVAWQPVPVHTVPEEFDHVIKTII